MPVTREGRQLPAERDWVTIGVVVKSFGVNGAMRVRPLSDVPGRFQGLPALPSVLLVAKSGRTLETSVSSVKAHDRDFVIAVRDVTTPETAAAFSGAYVKIAREHSPPLPSDQYYQHDLVGLTVYVEGEPDAIGLIEEVWQTGSNAVFVVRDGSRETLIPATKQVVAAVDLTGRRMVVRRVEGLFDDTAAM